MTITTRSFNVRGSMANTLEPSLGLHKSGWTIDGIICEDYYVWINDFIAFHDDYGWVYGNYEDKVFAKSLMALEHFMSNHPPCEWDYGDI